MKVRVCVLKRRKGIFSNDEKCVSRPSTFSLKSSVCSRLKYLFEVSQKRMMSHVIAATIANHLNASVEIPQKMNEYEVPSAIIQP